MFGYLIATVVIISALALIILNLVPFKKERLTHHGCELCDSSSCPNFGKAQSVSMDDKSSMSLECLTKEGK